MICSDCGASAREGDRHCTGCGAPLGAKLRPEAKFVLSSLKDNLKGMRESLQTIAFRPPTDLFPPLRPGPSAEPGSGEAVSSLDYRIVIIEGKRAGEIFDVGRIITLGRAENCEVQLTDIAVSREHCRIVFHPERRVFLLQDLGSQNGTLLNGQPMKKADLKSGDRIKIGEAIVLFYRGAVPDQARRELASRGIALGDDPTPARPPETAGAREPTPLPGLYRAAGNSPPVVDLDEEVDVARLTTPSLELLEEMEPEVVLDPVLPPAPRSPSTPPRAPSSLPQSAPLIPLGPLPDLAASAQAPLAELVIPPPPSSPAGPSPAGPPTPAPAAAVSQAGTGYGSANPWSRDLNELDDMATIQLPAFSVAALVGGASPGTASLPGASLGGGRPSTVGEQADQELGTAETAVAPVGPDDEDAPTPERGLPAQARPAGAAPDDAVLLDSPLEPEEATELADLRPRAASVRSDLGEAAGFAAPDLFQITLESGPAGATPRRSPAPAAGPGEPVVVGKPVIERQGAGSSRSKATTEPVGVPVPRVVVSPVPVGVPTTPAEASAPGKLPATTHEQPTSPGASASAEDELNPFSTSAPASKLFVITMILLLLAAVAGLTWYFITQ